MPGGEANEREGGGPGPTLELILNVTLVKLEFSSRGMQSGGRSLQQLTAQKRGEGFTP